MAVQNVNFPAANNLQKNALDGKANTKRCRKIWGSQTQPGLFPSTQLTLRGVPMDVHTNCGHGEDAGAMCKANNKK